MLYTFRIKRMYHEELVVSYITKWCDDVTQAKQEAHTLIQKYEDADVRYKEGHGLGGEWQL